MRVTFLAQFFDPEPGALRGLPLARALVRSGFDVQVVTGVPNYPGGKVYPGYEMHPWQREVVDDVTILRVALYPSHDQSAVRRICNYVSFAASAAVLGPLLTDRADVLYVYHPPPTIGLAAASFRAAHSVPIVYHIADMWPESAIESGMLGGGRAKALAGAAIDRYCRWVYRQCAAITVLSPGFKRLLVERGVPSERVHVLYNWADEDRFRPVARDGALARDLGLEGRFNIVYAGNLGPLQGLETVVQAASLVRDLADAQIVFAGGGVDELRLRQLAARSGASNVRFLGRQPLDAMPAINALADVLLVHLRDLPFFAATIPSKTQVSLASGRPILMAVAGDAAELIRAAGAGLTVLPEDPRAMADAIRALHAMPSTERERMGAAGRAYYARELSLAVGVRRMAEIFTDVVAA